MSLGRYLIGVLGLVAVLMPPAIVGRTLRRHFLPGWRGASAVLAGVVLALAALVGTAQVLGTIGLFATAPLALAGATVAALVMRRLPPADDVGAASASTTEDRLQVSVAASVATVVGAAWVSRALSSLHDGMTEIETLRYHMPFAARFVQDALVTGVYVTSLEPRVAYNPATSELLHGVLMLPFGGETLSPLVNLGWLGLLFLAGWCAGAPRGRGAATLTAAAVGAALPIILLTQASGANNDVASVSLLLAGVALLLQPDAGGVVRVVAAVAAGLAFSMKFTMVGPVAALTVAVVWVAPRGTRSRVARSWGIALAGAGSFWYLRNLARTGNPLPGLRLGIGRWHLPYAPPTATQASFDVPLVRFLDDPRILWQYHRISAGDAWGVVWPVVVALAFVGCVAALRTPDRDVRAVGGVGLAAGVLFFFTPGSGATFFANSRYALPAFMLGLVALPLSRWASDVRRSRAIVAVSAGTVGVTFAFLADRWFLSRSPVLLLLGAAVAALALAAVALRRTIAGLARRHRWVIAAACIVALTVGFVEQRYYLDHRYTADGPPPAQVLASTTPAVLGVYHALDEMRDADIGVSGFIAHYPLVGDDLSNRVTYIGRSGPGPRFTAYDTCAEWRGALLDGGFDAVVTAPENFPFGFQETPREHAWTVDDPATDEVFRDGPVSVFLLDGGLDPRACPGAG